ncbi:MAG: hypothetical protein JSW68_10025 [Burkholderiales bacterium]|nr:MAG: hypothetical protein JSW68_10025 [Burkholderiales bacterium]
MSLPAVERLAELANADAWLVHRGRHLSVTWLLEIGARAWLVHIHRGRIESADPGPFVMPQWRFALRADEDAWSRFWQAVPPPGFHDLLALLKFRRLRIEGDQQPFMANLLYFKGLLACLRPQSGQATE